MPFSASAFAAAYGGVGPSPMPSDFKARPEWVETYVKPGKIFSYKWERLTRFVITKVEPDMISAEDRWVNAGMQVMCDNADQLFWSSEPLALQVGDAWQFLDDAGSRDVFVVQQMTWDEVKDRWMWQLGKPDPSGKMTTVWRAEDEILMRADRYIAPVAPKVTRRGNAKCGCGSAAFQLLNALECFNPNCRNYVPEKT